MTQETTDSKTTKWRPINTMPRDRMVLVSDGDLVKPGTRVAEDVIAAPILTTIKLWTHWREFPEPPEMPTDNKTTLAALTPAALAALLHERTGGAWKAVPVEATLDMLIEATEEWTCIRAYEDRAAAIWRAMLAAAPAPEPPK